MRIERDNFGRFIKGFISPNRTGEDRKCLICKKVFHVCGSKIKEGKGLYCSIRCSRVGIKGRRNSPKTEFKKGQFCGEKHFFWKGENVGYHALHRWVQSKLGKASKCSNPNCVYPRKNKRGELMLKPKGFQWANIDHKYKRDLNDYVSLCGSCHKLYDMGLIEII